MLHASSRWTPPPVAWQLQDAGPRGPNVQHSPIAGHLYRRRSPTAGGFAAPSIPLHYFILLLSSAFFAWCPLLLTSVHPQSKVSFSPSSITLSYSFSALELLLLLSGQCPNPGPVSYPCPVCHRPNEYSRTNEYNRINEYSRTWWMAHSHHTHTKTHLVQSIYENDGFPC